ncbi:MAG: peptidoglycan editing factor PgeF [Bacteroidaceae bacterium]|nr:peptidoglycan editing factor PgeF [Bacteroidaceae bacterium]
MLKYYDMTPNITAFSSTRHGGFSEGNYASFNINQYCGDNNTHIIENRELLCKKLHIKGSRLIMPHQVHGVNIKLIDESFFSKTENEQRISLEGVDALMTQERYTCLGISTADCVPILIYDHEKHAIAAVHAGWRGTQQRIVEKTIKEMSRCFCSAATSLLATIGPSIGPDAFEVGPEVYESFLLSGFPMEKISKKIAGKWHIDLWQANAISLENMGVLRQNIQISGICTYTHSNDFFSARKLTINSGRILSGIIQR